jgi:hypothetical protein
MSSLIGDYNNHSFSVFMDDYGAAATDFDTLFEFLHTQSGQFTYQATEPTFSHEA